jgi:hypothetical protein
MLLLTPRYAYKEDDEVLLGEVELGHDAESGRIVDKSGSVPEIIICGITGMSLINFLLFLFQMVSIMIDFSVAPILFFFSFSCIDFIL